MRLCETRSETRAATRGPAVPGPAIPDLGAAGPASALDRAAAGPIIAADRRLVCDTAGATMVMGVFISVLLVGMIYYVWGIGDTILHRERMQDAADTAAFGAAVIHARGMNTLALINMVMAGLAMASATLAVIRNMIGIAAATAAAVCSFCGPMCGVCCEACVWAALHTGQYENVRAIHGRVQDVADKTMGALHVFAEGVRRGVPAAAQSQVIRYGSHVYAPVSHAGAMAPVRPGLPAEDDETNWPCERVVWPRVALWSPVKVWVYAWYPSEYMLAGVAGGHPTAAVESRRFCEEGSFQRVTDEAQTMGNDAYQVQAYMLGDPDLDWTAEGVAVATWGQDEGVGAAQRRVAEMGRVGFAQAEFFYDDEESDWHEWLWHMRWRARLRRWRSSAAGMGGVIGACGGGPGCGALGEIGSDIDDAVVH